MKLKIKRGFNLGTRINTIEVPEELRAKQTSGIKWFDEALGDEGGFTRTSVMMLTGGAGTGKSTLMRQLADSMTRQGHIVVYNSGEESLYQVRMSCERLKLEQNFMVGEETMLPKFLEFLDDLVAVSGGKTVVFLQDSLQTLDDGKYMDATGESLGTNSKTPVRCTELLVDWAQQNFGVVVFVCQVTKSGVFAGSNKIKHAIDVHGHLYVDMAPKSETYGQLLFDVQKNRWGCTGATFMLDMTSTGIESRGSFDKLGR